MTWTAGDSRGALRHHRLMCNDKRSHLSAAEIEEAFSEQRIPLRFPEGVPNLEPRDDIRITDRHAMIRAAEGGGAELVVRRWSWPGPKGAPVYNFRSEGRKFESHRCLIPVDGFYEFTDPAREPGAPKAKRKDKWLFTIRDEPLFCIAGVWRADPAVGEAYSLLTVEPGPDVAPYHSRQIVVLSRRDWRAWLDPNVSAVEVLRPSPAGMLNVRQVR